MVRFLVIYFAGFCLVLCKKKLTQEFMMIGIIFGGGQAWAEQIKFAIRNLRDFGFGKTSMEGLIMEEVKELLHWIKQQHGKPIALHRRLVLATVNALWTILSGERYEHNDPHLTEMLDNFQTYVI